MNILGLKIVSHDTGAALMSEKGVVAISEERLNRIKHSKGIFPELAIKYCLDAHNVKPEEIDYVVIDQINHRSVIKMDEIFKNWDKNQRFRNAKLVVINHHDAHAASAFFCSPFQEAAILIYDGAGEQLTTHLGVDAYEMESYYHGVGNTLKLLDKTMHVLTPNLKYPYSTYGVGKLYSRLSSRYVNFGPYSEGKMMGLAAYGDDRILKKFPMDKWFREYLGHPICNGQISYLESSDEKKNLRKGLSLVGIVEDIFNKLKNKLLTALRRFSETIFLYLHQKSSENRIVSTKLFDPIILEKPARSKSDPLPDKYYASVAYAVQHIMEEFAVRCGNKLRSITHTDNIAISGGLGLNIDSNKHFINKVGFKNIFIQPAASDMGIPLGCALYGWHILAGKPRTWEMKSASIGRPYKEDEILGAITKSANLINYEKSIDICKDTARVLAEGKIVGWFQGGSEYGPRALGNRSIICDARGKETKDTLNNKVKHREPWRPFATSMLAEHVQEWFHLSIPSPFMLLEGKVLDEKKDLIPAVLHVDDTSRIQAVTSESNARYYKLISEFNSITGIPLILNTSFNLAGDPIVETPEDALNTFLKTEMDYLILEDYIVSKKQAK